MKGLTKRQREIVDYIEQYIAMHHYSPSYREMMRHFGFRSPGSIYKHIQTLKRKGHIATEKQCSRSLALTKNVSEDQKSLQLEISFLGQISAGAPIETFSQSQTFTVPSFLVLNPESTYALRARGDSLIDEQINDGDILIVEAATEAAPGDTVILLASTSEALVKKFYPEGLYVRLTSNHPNHPPLVVRNEDISIQGIIVGLLRFYQ